MRNKHKPLKVLTKYWAIYLIALKETLYYPQKLRASVITSSFRILVIIVIYQYAFGYIGREVNGINAEIAMWSISIYHILLYAQFRGVFTTINNEIRRGSFETQLNKPYSYLAYKLFEQLGKGLPFLIVTLLTVVPLLYILTGGLPVPFDLTIVLGGLCLTAVGTLVSAALYILIVLPAFWIDDAQPLFWLVDKAILVFGGSYIPVALLPSSFQTFANLTPFGAPMFATQMFNPAFPERWLALLTVQIFWFVLLLPAVLVTFRRAKVKLSVNGG